MESGKGCYDIDGIKVKDVVYKIPDGIHVTVTKKNRVLPHSFLGTLLYYSGGGVLGNPQDSSWNALFPEEKWV